MRLVEKCTQALRYHGTHIVDLQQLLNAGTHDGVYATEMPCQIFGRGFSHMAYAQSKHKARQSGGLGFLKTYKQIVG
jgi:hypothetical protein